MENIEFESLFEKYDPPQGGFQGFQEKLERSERKKPFFTAPRVTLASAFVAVVLLAVFFTPDLIKPKRNLFIDLVNASDNPVFIKYGYKKPTGESVSIPDTAKSHMAALRVETSDKNVKFYLIGRKI
jgi:hypothetical protein